MSRTEDVTRLLSAAARIDTLLEVQIPRWYSTFVDEIDTVRRARNSIVYGYPISDENVTAARNLAEKVAQAGEAAMAFIDARGA